MKGDPRQIFFVSGPRELGRVIHDRHPHVALLIRLHGRGGAFETTGIGQDAATNARFAKLADKERLRRNAR